MRAMVLNEPGPVAEARLALTEVAEPAPASGEVLLGVRACGVCRTDLHVVEGELAEPKLPLIPGHQIVGEVEAVGEAVERLEVGDRVGVGWLGGTCGTCRFCRTGHENLCDEAVFTGYRKDGGYAEKAVAQAEFAFPVPDGFGDLEAAPLLCAGLIGYRALRLAEVDGLGGPGRLGLYGFGASAHIVIQMALHRGHEVYAFTRGGDGQEFAREMGAVWAGGGEDAPPAELDSAIIFAPAGELVPVALRALRKGGVLVCAGIHMSPIPELRYEWLWGERIVRSVANLTRRDGVEFLELAPQIPIRTTVHTFPLKEANETLRQLKAGEFAGAAVLVP